MELLWRYIEDDGELSSDDHASSLPGRLSHIESISADVNWDQLWSVLSDLPLRDRVVIELDMTLALRPELFALKWRVFDQETSTLHIQETVYKNNLRQWERPKRACHRFPYRRILGSWCRYSPVERAVSRLQPRGVYVSESRRRIYGYGQLPEARASQACGRPGIAEADVPVHSEDDSQTGPEEGDSERCPGGHAALPDGNDDRRLYAGDSGECPGDDRLNQSGVAEAGSGGSGTRTSSGKFAQETQRTYAIGHRRSSFREGNRPCRREWIGQREGVVMRLEIGKIAVDTNRDTKLEGRSLQVGEIIGGPDRDRTSSMPF